jgi:hypothetical protein
VTHYPPSHQATLFPESLDELIAQDHPVRLIDAFVDSLDLGRWSSRKSFLSSLGVVRGFYEDTLEAMHQRAMSNPVLMRQKRSVVEHPFGTIK